MWKVKIAFILGVIIVGIISLVIGSISIPAPITHQKHVKRRKREIDEQSDTRSGFYSVLDTVVSDESDDEYYSAEEV